MRIIVLALVPHQMGRLCVFGSAAAFFADYAVFMRLNLKFSLTRRTAIKYVLKSFRPVATLIKVAVFFLLGKIIDVYSLADSFVNFFNRHFLYFFRRKRYRNVYIYNAVLQIFAPG